MGPTTTESPTRARCNKCGTITGGRGATVALSHPSAAAHAASSARGCRLKRRAHTALHESGHVAHHQRKTRTRDSRHCVVFESRWNIPSGVPLPSKESHFEALLIRGSKPGPSEVRQAPQITRVRDCRDVPYKPPSNAEFETSYAVFKASRGCLEGGSHRGRASSPRTLSNGPEPRLANPRKRFMRRVHGPRADPYRTGHGRPLEQPANSSPKQPWHAARAWVAWCASPLLPAEGRRGS